MRARAAICLVKPIRKEQVGERIRPRGSLQMRVCANHASFCNADGTTMDEDEAMFSVVADARVLVHGKYAGTIRYVPDRRTALVGVELDRACGDNDGIDEDGRRLFQCKPLHGLFVREEQLGFRRLVYSNAWNLLDNTQEQLNLMRSEKFKAAEHTIAQLTKGRVRSLPSNHDLHISTRDFAVDLHSSNCDLHPPNHNFRLVSRILCSLTPCFSFLLPTWSSQSLSRTVSDAEVAGIAIEADYRGPHVHWPLELSNVLAVLDSFKTSQVLHHKYVLELLNAGVRALAPLPTLQEITVAEGEKLTVIGDLHGQLQDLFSIFSINGLPSPTNKYLFNGDFVDRGLYGTEVVMTLLLFRLLDPTSVYLNRGNHESRNQNSWMGFEDEVWGKYSGAADGDLERPARLFERFQALFEVLPLCAVLQSKIFVVHGGLFSRDNVTLAHLRGIARKREPPLHQLGFEDKIFEDMLWSDPRAIQSRQPSERGAGVEFGVNVTNNFCLVNKIALIIRSHECVPEGFEILHGGRLITLFSASRYCGTQMNKGAFLTLGPELQPEIQQFYAHALNESSFTTAAPPEQAQLQGVLEEDTLRMIAERICDHKPSLFWYFTQHDDEHDGTVSRLVWAEALRSVLQLELPFLTYQPKLAALVDENSTRINYSQFLARYRIENDAVD
ncbi:hypothetical protein BBJ28_00022065, partial [Nothophytophthora sp. Chile5]